LSIPPKKIWLLVNPNAGQRRTRRIVAAAEKYFRAPAWRLAVTVLSGPGEAARLAAQAAQRAFYAVLVAGGDGTVNEVATALAGKKCALGVIPGGTGNGFARALKLPLRPEEACEALSRGRLRQIDLGGAGKGRAFVSTCGVGFDAWAAGRANELRWVNRVSGFLRYLSASLLSAFEFRPLNLKVTVDGLAIEGRCLLAVVSNGDQYGFGVSVAPGALLDDGWLDVVLVPPMNLAKLAFNGFRAWQGRALFGVRRLKGKSIVIESLEARELPVHLDGESAGTTPLKLRIRPKALKILLP
jgi:diacylglycerol kinase (ATP)